MSEYTHVEKQFLDQLQGLWRENMIRPNGATQVAKWRLYKTDPEEKF